MFNERIFSDEQINEIVSLLASLDTDTKVYLGCDSVRIRKDGQDYGKYATVCIVHINGKNGCRIFSRKDVEPVYDVKKNRPKMRMMSEVMRVCALYKQLMPHIEQFAELEETANGQVEVREFDVEIHLDISEDPQQGSNCAAREAAGYVLGMTGVEPKLKPHGFASSFGADHIANKG